MNLYSYFVYFYIWPFINISGAFQVALVVKACLVLLVNPMDGEAWQATVDRVAQSWTRLK